jgi:tetratricopeptide (TPR) repeat protein
VASYEEFVAAGDAPSAGRAAAFIALTYCEMGKADNAFIWYTKGTGGGTGDADKPLWLLVRGRIVWEREKGKEVLTWFEEAYQLQKKQKAFHAMAELCRLSAMVRVHFGQYADAKALIDEALDLSDRSGLRPGRAKILLAAGEIYKLAGDEQAGKRFLERAGECGGGKK